MQENHGIDPDCYTCLVNQARATARHASLNREQTQEVLDTAQLLLKLKNQDLYAEAKAQSHRMANRFAQSFREQLFKDSDPLAFGIQLAAAGNIIDFGAKEHGSLDLQQELQSVCHLEFGWDSDAFRERLSRAGVLLYICDNVGEIDFDRLLMEYLQPCANVLLLMMPLWMTHSRRVCKTMLR